MRFIIQAPTIDGYRALCQRKLSLALIEVIILSFFEICIE